MSAISLTIIVPAFDEEESIAQTIAELYPYTETDGVTLMVVNDGSTDRTAEILAEHAADRPRLTVVNVPVNKGYGAALKTGLRAATTELVAITDADGTYPNERLMELARLCENKDMVVGARIGADVKYSKIRAVPKIFLTRWVSWIAKQQVPDINSGLRVFRRDVAREFAGIFPDGFSFTITITLAMLTTGRQVEFVPINYAHRQGKSKIQPIRDTMRFLQIILRTGTYFAPIRAFLPIIGVLLLAAIVSLGFDLYYQDLTEKTLLLFLFALNTGMFTLLADMIDKRSS
ncbi:MAG: glycosyltransferase family 2 protein [Erythrobacter sp.]|jgi:glycosyltransferase involved in cell wall biosynthesis|nr:glycosyltransferase family 2 protein [Erythrobacter sp.]